MSKKRKKDHRQSAHDQANELVNPIRHSSATTTAGLPRFTERKIVIESNRSTNFRQSVQDKLNKALELNTARQVDAAMALYRQVIQEEPRAHTAYSNLSVLMYQSGETEAAITMMDGVLRKFPKVVTLRMNMARLSIQEKRFEEARVHLRALDSVEKFTLDEFYHYTTTWAVYLAAQGDYKGANYWLRLLSSVVPVGFGIRWQQLLNWLLGRFQKTKAGGREFRE